jgi:hypothetical protein
MSVDGRDDDREVYWRAPVSPGEARRMLRRLGESRCPVELPKFKAPASPPRMPSIEDYVALGVPRERAEEAVRARNASRQPRR